VKRNNQSEFGIRSETGEIYMLTKNERILTIEILKLTLATAAGREFVVERFGKEGLKVAVGLLQEMGVQINEPKERKPKTFSKFEFVVRETGARFRQQRGVPRPRKELH
jgi:hypothetical protein